jgi:hypothetical protein
VRVRDRAAEYCNKFEFGIGLILDGGFESRWGRHCWGRFVTSGDIEDRDVTVEHLPIPDHGCLH